MNITELISKYESKLILKNYSERTVDVYVSALGIFLSYIQSNDVKYVTSKTLEDFFRFAAVDLGSGYSMMKQLLASVKFLYQDVLKNDIDFELNRQKARKTGTLFCHLKYLNC